MNKDWLFVDGNHICDVRVAGVLIWDGKILVQRDYDGNEYALPGGHLKYDETLEDALIREYKEEMGADIICTKMLWSEECFWEWNGRRTHNLCFYYLIELKEGSVIPDMGEFVPHHDNDKVVFGWMPLEEIRNVVIYPEFLNEEMEHLDEGMKHFITRA